MADPPQLRNFDTTMEAQDEFLSWILYKNMTGAVA